MNDGYSVLVLEGLQVAAYVRRAGASLERVERVQSFVCCILDSSACGNRTLPRSTLPRALGVRKPLGSSCKIRTIGSVEC